MSPALFTYALALVGGLAAGGCYFALLAKSTRMHLDGAPLGRLLVLFVLRFAGAGALFWVAAQYGALALLVALGGFMLARGAIQGFVVNRP